MEKQEAMDIFGALAGEARLDIFRLLVRAGLDGLPAGRIGEALKMPAATLSFHLKELKNASLVACRRDGRSRIYSPNFDATNGVIAFLTENCCQGVGDCAASACDPLDAADTASA